MRHGVVPLLALVLLASAGSPLRAQTAGTASRAGGGDFTPFVAVLKAAAKDTGIVLTWKDSPDVRGANLVYRATAEISTATLPKATLVGTVPTGTQTFADRPPDTGKYFYALVVRDDQGKVYGTLVPFRNVTSQGVAVSVVAAETERAAAITGIAARALPDGSGIAVGFSASSLERDLLLFWATAPFSTAEDLLRAAGRQALQPGTSVTTVTVAAGTYWFAVLDAGLFRIGQTPLVAGGNATIDGVRVPAVAAAAPAVPVAAAPAAPAVAPVARAVASPPPATAAPVPETDRAGTLPLLDPRLADELPTAPRRREVSPATENAITVLMRQAAPAAAPARVVEVLPAVTTDDTGEGALLRDIALGPLAGGSYADAERQLEGFLSLQRPAAIGARARFYLGQALWFQGKAREALLEFLASDTELPREARPWEDACLDALARS